MSSKAKVLQRLGRCRYRCVTFEYIYNKRSDYPDKNVIKRDYMSRVNIVNSRLSLAEVGYSSNET